MSSPFDDPIFKTAFDDLLKRLAELERTGGDIDTDFASADRLFSHFEERVSELENRMNQLQPQPPRCRQCKRIMRAITGKCDVCGAVN